MQQKRLDEMMENLNREKKVSQVFEVEDQAHLYTKCSRVYNLDPGPGDLFYASVMEMKIHFWKKKKTWDKVLQMADYNDTGGTAYQHRGWTNEMTSLPRVPRKDAQYRNKGTGSGGKRTMWKQEQEHVSWMKELIGKLTRGGDLVMSFCPGTCPTVQACMVLDQHRTSAGYDLDSDV